MTHPTFRYDKDRILSPDGAFQVGAVVAGADVFNPIVLANDATPMIMPPGDGATAGLQWSGTAGAFTLVGAVNFQAYTFPCDVFLYMPAGAIAGTGNAAGLYYAQLTSATAGTVYNNRYFGGLPRAAIPAVPTPFSGVTNGAFITQTTGAEITVLSIAVPGGLMGSNGVLRTMEFTSANNNANGKTVRWRSPSSQLRGSSLASGVGLQAGSSLRNRNSQSRQVVGNGQNGDYSTVGQNVFHTVNTAADWSLTLTLQTAVNTDIVALEAFEVQVIPG